MKTIITISSDPIGGSKVTVQVDDQVPAVVHTMPPATPPPTPEAPVINTAPPPASPTEVKPDERKCQICGDPLAGYHRLAKICNKPECKKEKHRRYQADKYKSKAKEKATGDPVHYCRHCEAYTTHTSAEHRQNPDKAVGGNKGVVVSKPAPLNPGPDFLPGHEKSAEQIEEWKPKPILPGSPEYSQAPRGETSGPQK